MYGGTGRRAKKMKRASGGIADAFVVSMRLRSVMLAYVGVRADAKTQQPEDTTVLPSEISL
eukprot:39984-Eustigmatos_ZCMA.PRE.1